MSTIIDQLTEKPVTFYYVAVSFCVSFYMLIAKSNASIYFFIPSRFLAGQWWRIFTAPIVCADGILIIISCSLIIYFGRQLEKKVSSENYFKALIIGYAMIILSLIVISFIPHLPMPFSPIFNGPCAITVFIIQLYAHIDPNYSVKLIFNIPMALIPILSAVIFICFNFFASSILLALLYGYIFPDIFPEIIKRAPNNAQNMAYNPAGFWVKKPSNKPKGSFSGKPHKLND